MTKPQIDFYFEFASTYSYLSVMRIEEICQKADVQLNWRPFLLGPIFASQGMDNSPFNIYPIKGSYMWRDMERQCELLSLSFAKPNPFPQNGLHAARIAIVGDGQSWQNDFVKQVYLAQFAHGRDISSPDILHDILESLELDLEDIVTASKSDQTKIKLREQTEKAQKLGIFGAPTFITTDGELFWGNDRLEQALDWARRS